MAKIYCGAAIPGSYKTLKFMHAIDATPSKTGSVLLFSSDGVARKAPACESNIIQVLH